MLTAKELLDYSYNRCLPDIYRIEDKRIGFPLYRYLSSITEGGYAHTLEDTENLITLVDPENCPDKFFPALYSSFGLDYLPNVDVKYHRKFLMNYGELKKRRGTYSCIKFLVKVLTSLDVTLQYSRGVYEGVQGRHLVMTLLASSIADVVNMENDKALVQQFVGLFLPFYITTHVESRIATQTAKVTVFRGNALSQYSRYEIRPIQQT